MNMLTRKRFITGSASALAATLFSSGLMSCSGGDKLKNFGFISGIIGKELEGDWKKVLQLAHEFGYTEIETGNYLGDSASSFVSFLKRIGLTPVAGGLDFSAKDEDLRKSFTLINSMQMKYTVVYWPWHTGGPFSLEDCKKVQTG
jgi:hypothetical protein